MYGKNVGKVDSSWAAAGRVGHASRQSLLRRYFADLHRVQTLTLVEQLKQFAFVHAVESLSQRRL
jgi:hypothetical protein